MNLRVLSLIALTFVALSPLAMAEAPPESAGPAGAAWHHLHLGASDTAAAAAWYGQYMEGQAIKSGPFDIAMFGETAVVFMRRMGEQEGSSGSSIDHVGWSFPDLEAKMAEFEAAGIKIVAPMMSLGKIKFAFIEDPWGTKIEVMQDPDLIGFHHVHLHLTDPPAAQEWYANAFGGEVKRYGGFLPAVKFDNMWLIIQKTPEAKAPTLGRSVDHIGWSFDDLDAGLAHLKTLGIEPKGAPIQMGPLRFTFVQGDGGVRIEVLENKAPAEAGPDKSGEKEAGHAATPDEPAAEEIRALGGAE
jgi:catechol 2,3-dioxygenase-like lactoylglutathione lyase family enzyme